MMQNQPALISLRVPGKKEYGLVIRTALSGVAVLMDLDVNTMDDLRMAADEACDCLFHQGRKVTEVVVEVREVGEHIQVSLLASFEGEMACFNEQETKITRAVLETLAAQVNVVCEPCGCVCRIDLTMARAA